MNTAGRGVADLASPAPAWGSLPLLFLIAPHLDSVPGQILDSRACSGACAWQPILSIGPGFEALCSINFFSQKQQ